MKLSFYGADQCVTGSCHCLEVNGRRILVDCGLQQGRDEVSNDAFPFAANDIDFVLVTHAHIDHTGRIPMLVKQGFQGRIVATRLTADLMDIMLQDSAHIQESDAEWKNRKAERSGAPRVEPLYTIEDAQRVSQYMTTCEYNQPLDLCEGVRVEFVDAGHLLGSASILVTATEGGITKQIVFSGDIGNVDQPIIRDPTYLTGADYVVMESTYGDRNHTEVWSYTDDLAKIIDETIAKEKLNWFADLVKSGDFRLVGEDVFFSGPFGSQAVASYIGSSAGVSYVELAVNDAFEIGCVPIPQEGPVRYISSWGNNFACLSTDEDHARGAYLFLKFLTSTENIVQWAEAFGTVPIYKEARESAEFQQFAETNIAVKALTEEADDIGMLASVPGAAAMRTEIDKMVQSVALNVSDADTAYAAFETACREALAK